MRKSLLIGVAATVILALGVTVGWVSAPEGRLSVSAPAALAQATDGPNWYRLAERLQGCWRGKRRRGRSGCGGLHCSWCTGWRF